MLLTFIIPVRHQDNAKDWSALKANLEQTIASISGQDHDDWRALIVCNHGADLPPLPEKFEDVRVDFSPNLKHEREGHSTKDFYDAFRVDKGSRVLAGMLHARDSEYFMIVDDDDFVSAKITGFVDANRGASGWKITRGYVWGDGGDLVFKLDNFDKLCGTSLIISKASYGLPDSFEAASQQYIMDYLGSHVRIADILEDAGRPLSELPFRGAIYRVGHSGAHSQSRGLVRQNLLNRKTMMNPPKFIGNLFRFGRVNARLRREFFGERKG